MDKLCVGETTIGVVNLGDDTSSINKIFGLVYVHFQVGELVSVNRSDGVRKTIAQIRHVCPEFIELDLENRLEKQISAMEIPNVVGKLIGTYCLGSQISVFLAGIDPLAIPYQRGRSNIFPLSLGQDCSLLNSSSGLNSNCFALGELISFSDSEQGGLESCGLVQSISQQLITIDTGRGPIEIPAALAHKLHGEFYLPGSNCVGILPSIRLGTSNFQGIVLGQDTSCIARTNSFKSGQFYEGEPVSVKFRDGRRKAFKVLCVNPNESLSVESNETITMDENSVYSFVSKLEGSYYVTDGGHDHVLIEMHSTFVKIGQTVANCLQLGNHGPMLPLIEEIPPLYTGELVSLLLEDGTREITLVKAIDRNSSFVLERTGLGNVRYAWALRDSLVRKILGCYYILGSQRALSPPSSFLRVSALLYAVSAFLHLLTGPDVQFLTDAE
jgi:hypothetical protein